MPRRSTTAFVFSCAALRSAAHSRSRRDATVRMHVVELARLLEKRPPRFFLFCRRHRGPRQPEALSRMTRSSTARVLLRHGSSSDAKARPGAAELAELAEVAPERTALERLRWSEGYMLNPSLGARDAVTIFHFNGSE